jgi:hydroxymethylglutaryl-CoA reductase (NADPH)
MYGTSPEMLKRMYVKGSLKNKDDGFVFQVKNMIDSGSVSGISKLLVDGEERSLEGATVQIGEKEPRPVSGVSWSSSLYVGYGSTLTLYVPGELEPGEHTVTMKINVPELGQLSMPITDTVS